MNTEDLLAIRALTDRYSDAANRLDPKGMAAVYAEDGEIDAIGNLIKGRATIEEVFTSTIGLMEFMNQICSGGVIELDSDHATARWTVTEFCKRRDNEKFEMFMGTYDDEIVRGVDGWEFAKRVLSRRSQVRFEAVLRR